MAFFFANEKPKAFVDVASGAAVMKIKKTVRQDSPESLSYGKTFPHGQSKLSRVNKAEES